MHNFPLHANNEHATRNFREVAGLLGYGLTFRSLTMTVFSYLLWPAIISVPLFLTFKEAAFPSYLNDASPSLVQQNGSDFPSPFGLIVGIFAVVVGQICVLVFSHLHQLGYIGERIRVQNEKVEKYDVWLATIKHLSQPEGFVMLGGYLTITWMFKLMPASYYSFSGGINYIHVALQLLMVDFLQYAMHRLEHIVGGRLYQISHKPHHRHTIPKLFDAFDGSAGDTFLMILIPLFFTAQLVHTNVWSYMAFGSLYANWLCLLHSEYVMPWDNLFRKIGFGTSSDHHVHHALQKYNFGHLFM